MAYLSKSNGYILESLSERWYEYWIVLVLMVLEQGLAHFDIRCYISGLIKTDTYVVSQLLTCSRKPCTQNNRLQFMY